MFTRKHDLRCKDTTKKTIMQIYYGFFVIFYDFILKSAFALAVVTSSICSNEV